MLRVVIALSILLASETAIAGPRVRTWIDKRVGPAVIELTLDRLEGLARSVECIDVTFFGGSTPVGSASSVPYCWGPAPLDRPFDPLTVTLAPIEKLLANARERAIENARVAHTRTHELASTEFVARVRQELNRLRQDILSLPPSTRTVSLTDLVERLGNEQSPINLILTTGDLDNRDGIQIADLDSKIVLALGDDSASGNVIRARETRLSKIFRGALFVRPYNIEIAADIVNGALPPKRSTSVVRSQSPQGMGNGSSVTNEVLRITSPAANDSVSQAINLEFVGAQAGKHYVVVVHPRARGADTFWAQERAEIRPGATSLGPAIVGRPGNIDCGQPYELRVFETSKVLESGPMGAWPSAERSSITVPVIRGKDCVPMVQRNERK